MRNKRITKYPDDVDYNTNSNSYYDDLARKQKLIKLLAEKIYEYDKELGKRFEEWDDLIKQFPENVQQLLIEWLEDGTLENIVNDEVLGYKANQSDLDITNLNVTRLENKLFYNTPNNISDLQSLIDSNDYVVLAPNTIYTIDKELFLHDNLVIEGQDSTIKASENFEGTGLLNVSDKKNIKLKGLVIDCNGQSANPIIGVGTEDLTIKECEMFGGTQTGIRLEYVKRVRIENNKVHDFEKWCIFVKGVNSLTIKHNETFNCYGYDGIKVASENNDNATVTDNSNVLISDNESYNNGKDGIDYATNTGVNIKIINNTVYNNKLYGINLKTVYKGSFLENIVITGNICERNSLGGIEIVDQQRGSITGNNICTLNISDNSIIGKDNDSRDTGERGEIRVFNVKDVSIFNNNIRSGYTGIIMGGIVNGTLSGNKVNDSQRCIYVADSVRMNWDGLIEDRGLQTDNLLIHDNTAVATGDSGSFCIRFGIVGGTNIKNVFTSKNHLTNDPYRETIYILSGDNILNYDNIIGYGTTPPTSYSISKGVVFINTDISNGILKWINTSTEDLPVWTPISIQ